VGSVVRKYVGRSDYQQEERDNMEIYSYTLQKILPFLITYLIYCTVIKIQFFEASLKIWSGKQSATLFIS
jgi:hypothetical protein